MVVMAIPVVAQRFNLVLLHDAFVDDDQPELVHYQTNFVTRFCNF